MVFIDALVVNAGGGQVRSKPFCLAVGVNVDGEREIRESGGEGAKFWLGVLIEIKNRGCGGGVYRGVRRACGGQSDSITAC